MDFIDQINTKKQNSAQKQADTEKHSQLVTGNQQIEQAILDSAVRLVATIKTRPNNVVVDNFPTQLATTKDIQALREVLEKNTSKTLEKSKDGTEGLKTALMANLDKLEELVKKDNQGDVTAALSSIEEELKDKSVEVSNLDDLGNFFFELQQAIEAKDLSVNVEAPVVNVPEVDLSPIKELGKKIDALAKKVENIKLEHQALDEIPELLRENIKVSTDILNRPIPVPTVSKSGGQYGIVDIPYDYFSLATDTTTETYTYKRNGASGTTVAVVTITYTDSTKTTISTVVRTNA